MKPAAERLGSVLLAAAIAAGLAVVLVHWVDHSLVELETPARAALLAAPLGGWWAETVRRWRLALLNRELRYTMDEMAWTQEDIEHVLPRHLEKHRRHARLLQKRIEALEAQA